MAHEMSPPYFLNVRRSKRAMDSCLFPELVFAWPGGRFVAANACFECNGIRPYRGSPGRCAKTLASSAIVSEMHPEIPFTAQAHE